MTLTPRPLVLYHADCPDGFGAAWAYWRRWHHHADYVPLGHDDPTPEVANRVVVMVDVALDRQRMDHLAQSAQSFRLIDHHASAQAELADAPYAFFDLEASGAVLGWRDAHPGRPLPKLIACIEDRDLWRWHLPGSREVTFVLDTLGYDFARWDAFADRVERDWDAVVAEGRIMGRQFEAWCTRLIHHAVPVQQGNFHGLAVNAPREFASEVAHRLAQQADFGFTWSQGRDARIHGSWRSRANGGIDVIPLAEAFGGGGHPHGAGARLDWAQLQAFLESHPLPLALGRSRPRC